MIPTQPVDRIRDYLYEHGAASIDELVFACGVTRFDVLHSGYLKSSTRRGSHGVGFMHCVFCRAPAIVNDHCDACRRELIASGERRAEACAPQE